MAGADIAASPAVAIRILAKRFIVVAPSTSLDPKAGTKSPARSDIY
jgi:hypothetical protein